MEFGEIVPVAPEMEIRDWTRDWNRATREIRDWQPFEKRGASSATEKTEARSGKLFLSRPRWGSMIEFMIGTAPLKKFMVGSLLKSKEELSPV